MLLPELQLTFRAASPGVTLVMVGGGGLARSSVMDPVTALVTTAPELGMKSTHR